MPTEMRQTPCNMHATRRATCNAVCSIGNRHEPWHVAYNAYRDTWHSTRNAACAYNAQVLDGDILFRTTDSKKGDIERTLVQSLAFTYPRFDKSSPFGRELHSRYGIFLRSGLASECL